MGYFNEFPYTEYNFANNETKLVKNISFKPEIIERVKESRAAFETYLIQEGDTVELIANKLYGDVNLHWAVMISNDMVSPYLDMPLTSQQLDEFIFHKFKSQLDSENNIVILNKTKTLELTQFVGTTSNNFNTSIGGVIARPHHFIDKDKNRYSYDYIVNNPVKSNAYRRVEVAPIVTPVSTWTEEHDLNEAKRSILILKKSLVSQIKNEFKRVINE
tara:strand:+ start:4829 stop:5479 length:651 start_codon:yes stop_codon:yes gene_type:complete